MKNLLTLLIFIFDSVLLIFFKILIRRKQKSEGGRKQVIVVRLDAIGDSILWLDSYEKYIVLFPKEKFEIHLVCNEDCKEIFEQVNIHESLIPICRKLFIKNMGYRFSMLRKLYQASYDIVVNPMYSREFLFSDSVVRFSSAPKAQGFLGDLNNISSIERRYANRWYSSLVISKHQSLMELERNAEFVRALGYSSFKSSVPIWRNKGEMPPYDFCYYVIFPGSSRDIKMWPTANFIDLSKKINKKTGYIGIVCGGEKENKLINAFQSEMDEAHLKLMIGLTTLNNLGDLIKHSKFVISNDSSAIHLSAAVNTPSVCILGGFHPERFLPYRPEIIPENCRLPLYVRKQWECFNCNWNCRYIKNNHNIPAPCISEISVEEVWEKILEIINIK